MSVGRAKNREGKSTGEPQFGRRLNVDSGKVGMCNFYSNVSADCLFTQQLYFGGQTA